ncbi:MAG TPA: hypothetical protein VIJ88_00815 [Candidatus Paceibacterota bacterium]
MTIKERAQKGISIQAKFTSLNCPNLYQAACKYIGSWKLAVEAAGFTYADIRVGKAWSRELVIEGIQKRVSQGLAISSHAVQVEDYYLANAARKHFGSWKLAVEAAGFNYKDVNKYQRWSKDLIISAIKERAKKKLPLSFLEVRKDNNALHHAGVNHFGSWEAALEAAGFDYNKVIKLWYFRRRSKYCRVATK